MLVGFLLGITLSFKHAYTMMIRDAVIIIFILLSLKMSNNIDDSGNWCRIWEPSLGHSSTNVNNNNIRNTNGNIATAYDLDVHLNVQQMQAEARAAQQYQREANERQNVGGIMQSILSGEAPSCLSTSNYSTPMNCAPSGHCPSNKDHATNSTSAVHDMYKEFAKQTSDSAGFYSLGARSLFKS